MDSQCCTVLHRKRMGTAGRAAVPPPASPEPCIGALWKAACDPRNLRCYMLRNHDLPFDIVVEKLKVFERPRLWPAYSRFRPSTVLCDGYVPQKRGQGDDEYYNGLERQTGPHKRFFGIGHKGWPAWASTALTRCGATTANQASRRPSHLRRIIGTSTFLSVFLANTGIK